MSHICVSKLTIIGPDNGLSPGRRQAIIYTNAGILLIGPSGTNFSEILIEIRTFSSKKMDLKLSSAKWQPFCLSLNELILVWTLIGFFSKVQFVGPYWNETSCFWWYQPAAYTETSGFSTFLLQHNSVLMFMFKIWNSGTILYTFLHL